MTPEQLAATLAAHFRQHRLLAPQDVYKLLYQAVFGPEHALIDLASARMRFYQELIELPTTPSSLPLLEPVSPLLCRVNLQPFVQHGGDVRALWRAWRQTGQQFRPGTLADLQRYWAWFRASPWARRYLPEQLAQFWLQQATAGFPPVSHSAGYRAASAPHYRVVLRALLAGVLPAPSPMP
ncbi:MAG: hypothetical protein KatS3mg131_2302 [Candidatus Tectimicrobiota bacterium]|nr:MAG: hypothetical protein KatS3mg131_2302 [Candidatus Tectomicrobia bacterium]